ncbi:MAG: DUF4236 domain-containing protein [Treponema sp.]|nr:DUF4236 domain-containing protein [Treponema sp.]
MGFRFRKSINLGNGFRVNLSKSGFGYSWGIPGYRNTITSKGRNRKTYSIPGTGLSFVEESGSRNRHSTNTYNSTNNSIRKTESGTLYDANDYSAMENIESSDIKKMQPVEYKKILNQITLRILLNKLTTLMLPIFLLYFVYEKNILFLIVSGCGLLFKIILHIFCKIKVFYDFEDDYEDSFREYVNAWKDLSKSHKIFQIPLKASIQNSKNMYGAKQALERIHLSIRFKAPWYLKTNINIPVLYFKKNTIILFPEKVLIIGKIKAGAINQKDVEFDFFENGFVESDFKPKDSEFIQYQWIHPNKNGGPDRRFKNNRQLPVYNYGFIDISSNNGLNQRIMVTNNKICMRLSEFYKDYKKAFSF